MPGTPVEPHLFSDDLHELVAFYTGKLGFTLASQHPPGDDYTWCALALDGAMIMISTRLSSSSIADALREELEGRYGQPGAVIYYVEVSDVDAQYARVQEGGVRVLEPIWDAWWGLRQFTIADPEGNLIAFFTPLREGS